MSYNCDLFKVKKLENLRIPVASLFKHPRKDWHPNKEVNEDDTVTFRIMDMVEVTGIIENDILIVEEICCYGNGSGSAMEYVFEPAFEDSIGELIVSCVWEGGDSINQLIVKDGKVEWKDIDI